MKIVKKAMKVVMGSGLAVAALYMPEVLAVPSSPNIPIGDIVQADATIDVMLQNILGWLMVVASIGLGAGAFGYWGYGLFTGFGRLQDKNDKEYTTGSWLQVLLIGALTAVIAGVISFYLYGFGTGLIT